MYDFKIEENNYKNKAFDKVLLTFHKHDRGPSAIMKYVRKDYEKLIEDNIKIMEEYNTQKQNISFDKER